MNIALLAIDGVFDTGLSLLLDTFATANDLSAKPEQHVPFRVQVVAVRDRVTTQQGFRVPSAATDALPTPDLVVVPAIGAKSPEALARALEREEVGDAVAQIVAWQAGGARVAAACTGTYVLALTGLLDGRRATTSWWLGPDFRRRFSTVQLDETEMVVDEGGRVTAGAALAHVDLALWFVREHSPTLARTTSKHLLVDGRPSQATYAMSDHLAYSDPIVESFERWARQHLADFSMTAAAKAAGASERTLERRLRKILGQTPIAFVRRLRVERAVFLLETTDDSVESIAGQVGYGDGVTLRTLLREQTGLGIRQLRRQT
ncbi:MAG: helix-turn-helix domain-containing protein [Acidobacteriota bacterium]